MAGYHVENFGCRASRADGDGIAARLQAHGLSAACDLQSAEIVILNTCSVTAEADKDARAFIRKATRANPEARVLVTGCYAQRAPAELGALAGVDAVVGNSHKAMVADIAAGLLRQAPAAPNIVPLRQLVAPTLVDDTFAHSDIAFASPSDSTRTRPNLKVQDGCGNRCSFCVIPQTRGGSRSVPLARVLEEVTRFVEAGGQEMVLTGINLGRWGRDLAPAERFEDLVAAILGQTGLPRLRISSVEPMDWSEGLLALFSEFGGDHPRLAHHAHLPLQSGSDAILRAMYRRYRPWHYAARVAAVRLALPDAAIGADVMVGFPGETDALFEETYRFVAEQPFTYLHLFPFSARPGTAAWARHHEQPVRGEAVRERMARLRALVDAKHRAFCAGFIGRQLSVLTLLTADEERARSGTRALSDNFLPVEIRAELPPNQMVCVHVESLTASGLRVRLAGKTGIHGKITGRPASVAEAVASQMLY